MDGRLRTDPLLGLLGRPEGSPRLGVHAALAMFGDEKYGAKTLELVMNPRLLAGLDALLEGSCDPGDLLNRFCVAENFWVLPGRALNALAEYCHPADPCPAPLLSLRTAACCGRAAFSSFA